MDYYIVKNGIIKQNGGGKCSENKLKNAMMKGGSIVYDMYDDDILFLPKNNKIIKPSITWGNVINVRPKEIEKASISTITKVIKQFPKEQKAKVIKRGEELTEEIAKKYSILSTREVNEIINELEKIDRDSTLVRMKNSNEYNEFIKLLGDYFINYIQKSTTTDNYRLKLNIDVIKAKKDTEKIRNLYKNNILPRKFTKRIFIAEEIPVEYQEVRPRSDSFGTIADLVEADLRKKYKDFPEKIAEINKKSEKSKLMQERLALLQEFDTLKEEEYYDLTNIILKLKESIDDGSTKENKDLINYLFNLLNFNNYADKWDDTDYIVEVLVKMKNLKENLSPKQKEIVDKIMLRDEFKMYLAIIEDLNNNKDKFPEKKNLIEKIYSILQNATNENFIDENWVIMVRTEIDNLQKESEEEKLHNIDEEEYNKYKKLKESIVKGFSEFSRKNENFKKFKKAFEEFSAYYLSNTQNKTKPQELIPIIREEYNNFKESVKLLKSGCEEELEKRNCKLESISAGEGTYGTVYSAICQNKPYIMKIQIFADTEKIRGITIEHVFNNEVEYYKLFQNNPLKQYTVKYYDSWTCNGRDGNKTGYIQLEKMDGDVGELVKNNIFTNTEFKRVINIIENFHKLRFIHFDSKPNNYLYKKSGMLRTTYNIVSSDFGLTEYIDKDYITGNMFKILSMYDYYLFLYELRRFYYFKEKVEIDADKGLPNNFDILLNKPFKDSIMQIISMFIENAKDFNLEEFQSNPYYNVIIGLKISKFDYLMQYCSFIYKVNSIYNNNQDIREKYVNTVKEINDQFKNYLYFNDDPKSSDEEIININKIIKNFEIYNETITYYNKNVKKICENIDKTCINDTRINLCQKELDDIIKEKRSTEEVKKEIDIIKLRILDLKKASNFEKEHLIGEVKKLYPRTQITTSNWYEEQTCKELNQLIEEKKVKRQTGLEDALDDAITQIEEILNNAEREIDSNDITAFENNKSNLPELIKMVNRFKAKYPPRKVIKIPSQLGGRKNKIETYYF